MREEYHRLMCAVSARETGIRVRMYADTLVPAAELRDTVCSPKLRYKFSTKENLEHN